MLIEGTTISKSSGLISRAARSASFSQAMRTSPMLRRVKVIVAPRAHGRHDPHTRHRKIRPVANLFGIALADEEHDGRGIWRTVLRQSLLPVPGNETGTFNDGIDVVSKRQGDDISLQPETHGPCLRARAGVGLIYEDATPIFVAAIERQTPRSRSHKSDAWAHRRHLTV
jgi:hypothetical protein